MRYAVALVPRARETLGRVFLVVLVTPSEARGVTPFMPLRGRTSALGEGQDTPAHSDEVAVSEEARARRQNAGAKGGQACNPQLSYVHKGGRGYTCIRR